MERLIKRTEAARILGISTSALDDARAKGLITYVQYVENGNVFFTELDLLEFIKKSTKRAVPVEQRDTYRKRRPPSRR